MVFPCTSSKKQTYSLCPQATADRATVVNLSNHVYFNLGGHGSGWDQMKRHVLTIPHNQFTPDDSDYLPTGIVPDNNDCI